MPKLKTKIEERIRELVKIGTWHDNLPGTIETLGMPPIHLEHILMAIEKVTKVVRIDMLGVIEQWIPAIQEYEAVAKYDLSKPFSDQSEETLLFLLNILEK